MESNALAFRQEEGGMMMKRYVLLCSLGVALCVMGPAWADVFQVGEGRLAALQNKDGGWDWLLPDLNRNLSDAPNILAPTGMGLVAAYRVTGDPNYLAPLKKAGDYLLAKKPQYVTPEDGYFAVALDGIFGVTKYSDFVKKNFYEPLANGTYDYFGNGLFLMNTGTYVGVMRGAREHDGMANMAALDCGLGLYAAHLIGADTTVWIAATKQEINQLNAAGAYGAYDVLGLAGAVLGLASVQEDVDPTTGPYAAAGSLADLANILAGYQLSTGGFGWSSLSLKEGAENETVQETAIAVLALNELDRNSYLDKITKAADFLKSVQLPTGGWENFFHQGECNLLTGEALWAIGAADQAQEPENQAQEPEQP